MIPHTLIDLGASINVMTKDTMLKLNLQGSLRKTTIVLQLANLSTMTPEGIVEDVMVSINSWEHPADFLFPPHLSSNEKSKAMRKSAPFTWVGGNLFKLGPDQILRRCVREEEIFYILLTCHDGPCEGHFAAKRTAFKILQAGYYWPTLHQDVRRYIGQCDQCQRMGKPTPKDEISLQPQVTFEPFEKGGMDFVGPINPPSNQKQYIIVCTNYLKKWEETKAIKAATEEKVVEFLRENIFYKFGYPRELVEVTNKALEGILTKVVSNSRKDWADRLVEATWAYNTAWKTTTRFTPYELVYGKKALLSIEFEYNTLRMATLLDLDLSHAQRERLLQLNGLDEQRLQALLHTEVIQRQKNIWNDRNIKEKQFQKGDCVLLYDSRYKYFKGKLRTRWLGPYTVEKCNDNGSILIRIIHEEAIPMLFMGIG
eukprot:PITA_35107